MEVKRELVKTVGWNLFLRDGFLEFSFKKPYDVLLIPEMRNDMQALAVKLRTLRVEMGAFNRLVGTSLFQ